MLKVQNKSTKRIRVLQIIIYLVQIFLTSMPYVWAGRVTSENADGVLSYSALGMISNIGIQTGDPATEQMMNTLGICFISFLVIPVIALGFQIFDRYYNIKNVVSIICSFLGVLCIINFVGAQYLSLGSMLALILYVVSAFLSVMGIFARFLKEN